MRYVRRDKMNGVQRVYPYHIECKTCKKREIAYLPIERIDVLPSSNNTSQHYFNGVLIGYSFFYKAIGWLIVISYSAEKKFKSSSAECEECDFKYRSSVFGDLE
jgi:hypothetical protein